MAKIVTPRAFSGMNTTLAQIFGLGPKFTVRCGNCPGTFKDRIEMIDHPTLLCPYCGAWNELPLVVTGGL